MTSTYLRRIAGYFMAIGMLCASLSGFAGPLNVIDADECVDALTGQGWKVAALPQVRLGIGVIVEGAPGQYFLGRSPYSASLHGTIVRTLLEQVQVTRILWMGEIKYRIKNGILAIVEANETSGFSQELMRSGLRHGDREIPVGNSVHAIPEALRAADFTPIPYDEANQHLITELSKIPGGSDIRHTVGNSIASLGAAIRQLKGTNEARADLVLNLVRENSNAHAKLIRHLVLNMIEENKLNLFDMRLLLNFLALLEDPAAGRTDFQSMDLPELENELKIVNEILATALSSSNVEIYAVPQ